MTVKESVLGVFRDVNAKVAIRVAEERKYTYFCVFSGAVVKLCKLSHERFAHRFAWEVTNTDPLEAAREMRNPSSGVITAAPKARRALDAVLAGKAVDANAGDDNAEHANYPDNEEEEEADMALSNTKKTTAKKTTTRPAAKKAAPKKPAAKKAAAKPSTPKTAAPKRGRRSSFDMAGKITWLVKENPRRAGSARGQAMEKYFGAKTVAEYMEKGGTSSTLRTEVKRGYLSVA